MSTPLPPSAGGVAAGMIDMESNTTLVQCYPAHQAVPADPGPFPPVLVLHDRFGLTPHIRHVANRLAHADFYALAPDFYCTPSSYSASAPEFMHSAAPSFVSYAEETAAHDRAAGLSDERALAILEQAIAYVAGRSKARAGGVHLFGFGTGARLAFLGACRFPDSVLSASCLFPVGLGAPKPPASGKPSPLDLAESLSAPILLFYGQLDMEIRPEEREAARRRLTDLGKTFRLELFREAGHDFFCEERDTYRIRASKIAWTESLAMFRAGVLPAPSTP